jgi:hypothetical protein
MLLVLRAAPNKPNCCSLPAAVLCCCSCNTRVLYLILATLAGESPASTVAAAHAAAGSAQEQQLADSRPWPCQQHASHYDGGDEPVVHDGLQGRQSR